MLITQEQLKKIAPNAPDTICELLNELCPKYGITDKIVFQMFLANVAQESLEFQHREENMNYRAETLMKVWPKRFPTLEIANQYARQPVKLANFVYGGRMGNTELGDGHQFKGGGFIGLTGKETYSKYAKHIGKDVSFTADLVRTSDRYALDSACWFFADLKKLIPVAKTGNFIAVVKGINGGIIGLRDRLMYYERCKTI